VGHQQELSPGSSSHQQEDCGPRVLSRKSGPWPRAIAGTDNLPGQMVLYETQYLTVDDGAPYDTSMDGYLNMDISPKIPCSSTITEDLIFNPQNCSLAEPRQRKKPPDKVRKAAKSPLARPSQCGSSHHVHGDSKLTVVPEDLTGRHSKPNHHLVLVAKTPAEKPPDHQPAGYSAKEPKARGPSGVNFHEVEKVQTSSSTSMTNFKLVQLFNLYGRHIVRNVSVSSNGGLKRRTLSIDQVLCRSFIDTFEEGRGLTPAFSSSNQVLKNIDNFIETPRETMRSLAKCQNILVGIALHKFRSELGLDDPNISAEKRKQLNNKFTTVQRTDRSASKRFLNDFCRKYGVDGDTPLEELETACQAAVVMLDNNGCISYISQNIIQKDYCIVTIMNGEDRMFLGKIKGLARPKEKLKPKHST